MRDLIDPEFEAELRRDMAKLRYEPFKHVMYSYPWGEPGTELERYKGPRVWQGQELKAIERALKACKGKKDQVIQRACATGHDSGKSALASWVMKWGMDTASDTRGIATANTGNQLKTKTWAELSKWHRLSYTRHWFELPATSIYSTEPGHEKEWRIDAVTWSENSTEGFAGLHNKDKRLIIMVDEASGIPDQIYQTLSGACADEYTEIIFLAFGNATRNVGWFYDAFHSAKGRWSGGSPLQLDCRNVEGVNQAHIQRDIEQYGLDSDVVRMRWLGLFPRSSSFQLIPGDLVHAARERKPLFIDTDPIIMGVDVARGGDDNAVLRYRRGFDARSIPKRVIPGRECHNSRVLVDAICEGIEEHGVDWVWIDEVGIGGPIVNWVRERGYKNVGGVVAGAKSPDPRCSNMTAYCWKTMKEWLRAGGAIDSCQTLFGDLTGREYHHNIAGQLCLADKEYLKDHGMASPDEGDSLSLTFAGKVAPRDQIVKTGNAILARRRRAAMIDNDTVDFDHRQF